jgi:hypothetical protein
MTSESFQQGYLALTAAFPGLQFNSTLLWRTLSDLDGEYFLMAVIDVIKTTKELYPGSNIIAILRARTEELKTETLQNNTLRLESETEKERIERWQKEAAPMPEDCKKALEQLGVKFGVKITAEVA